MLCQATVQLSGTRLIISDADKTIGFASHQLEAGHFKKTQVLKNVLRLLQWMDFHPFHVHTCFCSSLDTFRRKLKSFQWDKDIWKPLGHLHCEEICHGTIN